MFNVHKTPRVMVISLITVGMFASCGGDDATTPDAAGPGADSQAADTTAPDVTNTGDTGAASDTTSSADTATTSDSQSAADSATSADSGTADTSPNVTDVTTGDTGSADAGPGGCKVGDKSCGADQYCKAASCGKGVSGTCAKKPDICPMIAKPVCGCDGKTYGNACGAASAGVNVASEGACGGGGGGGCKVGDPLSCPSGEFCESPAGQCAKIGTCQQNPKICPKIYKPVCGCDGKTYGNDCERKSAGVSQQSDGPCGATGACKDGSDTCGGAQFCKVSVGSCGGSGNCDLKPQVCGAIYSPVCGCDGKTYSNECSAYAAGRNVDYKGQCKASNVCNAMNPCPKGQFCELSACMPGASGVCENPPKQPCPKTTPAAQVCGCDGKTYANDCLRKVAGVAKKGPGPCKP